MKELYQTRTGQDDRTGDEYRACFDELHKDDLSSNFRDVIKHLVGTDFGPNELRFRLTSLPQESGKRSLRVMEIACNGTDLIIGDDMETQEVNTPITGGQVRRILMDTYSVDEVEEMMLNGLNENGILIYDAKTPKGVETVGGIGGKDGCVTALKNRGNNEALLAILYIKP